MSRPARRVVHLPRPPVAPLASVWVRDFDEAAAERFARDVAAVRLERQPVLPVVITSGGGDVYTLMAMLDVLATFDGTVVTLALGQAMSCGAVLFTCGAEGHRYIAPNATLLLHDVSSAPVGGKADDQRVSATETARLNLLLWQRMARNIGKARDDLLAAHKARGAADWFVTAPEAVRLGLASQVGLPVFEWRQRLDPLLAIGAGE